MKGKKTYLKALLLISFFLVIFPPKIQTDAWGLIVHQFIADEATKQLPTEWQTVFDALIAKYKSGSIYPDSLHPQDTHNHLYYPDNPSGTDAPDAIQTWFNYFTNNLSKNNYADAIFAAGVMSHYFADINQPLHTGAYWDGHPAYESDLNRRLSEMTIGTITINNSITDVKQFAIDAAVHAHQYYDAIRAAYPDSTLNDEVVNNATIKSITEEQLTRAISGLASLLLLGIKGVSAPTVKITTTQKALVDNGHVNNYVKDGKLENFKNYLTGLGFEVVVNNGTISDQTLNDVDFLIVTAFETNYTDAELTAISNWLDGGKRSIFVTGRGDYSADIDHAGMNRLLETVGTTIRMNDDNVYTTASNPRYYKDWYLYTENVVAPPGKQYVDTAKVYHLYSPNSLYFTQDSNDRTILVNGSKYDYQTNQNDPPPAKIWDDTADDVGGERIPLVASESLNSDNDRIIVFGETSFSDFSFAPSGFHDDLYFMPTLVEWVLFDNVGEGIQFIPPTSTSSGVSSTPSSSATTPATSSWDFLLLIPAILGLVLLKRKRKER